MELARGLMSRVGAVAISAALIAVVALSPAGAATASCEGLIGLKIDNTTIDAAESHAAGAYTPAGGAEIVGLDLASMDSIKAAATADRLTRCSTHQRAVGPTTTTPWPSPQFSPRPDSQPPPQIQLAKRAMGRADQKL